MIHQDCNDSDDSGNPDHFSYSIKTTCTDQIAVLADSSDVDVPIFISDCGPGYIIDKILSPTVYRCLILPVGLYNSEANSTSCKRCPSGQITDFKGATDVSQCGTYL